MTGDHRAQRVEREPLAGPGYVPASTNPADFQRAGSSLLEELRGVRSLTPAVSDALDQLGWQLAVPSSILQRRAGAGTIVGHAVTIEYLPKRVMVHGADAFPDGSRLAHRHLFSTASKGDVAVFDARGEGNVSIFGGLAAEEAVAAGIGAVIVDGAVRDIADIAHNQLSVWSRGLTPVTGKWRLEATAINRVIVCGGVQVQAGDLVVADDSGMCFIPNQILDAVISIVREIVEHEEGARTGAFASPPP